MVSVFIMTKMKGYGVIIIIDVWFKIALFFHPFFLDWEEKCSRNLTLRSKVFNPLTAEWALRALRDFTLSNARRFYSSMGNPLDGKGLMCRANIWPALAPRERFPIFAGGLWSFNTIAATGVTRAQMEKNKTETMQLAWSIKFLWGGENFTASFKNCDKDVIYYNPL